MKDVLRLGIWATTCLVALRFAVGWHFFESGVVKVRDPNFRSADFLSRSTGPLADFFRGLVPDRFGRERLQEDRILAGWGAHQARVAAELGFDAQTQQAAAQIFEREAARLRDFFGQNREAIDTHFREVARLERAKRDPSLRDIEFQREWINRRDHQLQAATGVWFHRLRVLDQGFDRQLRALAGREGARTIGRASLPDLTAKTRIDHGVTALLLLLGALLLLGLLTRLACLGGILFLLAVLATQPFWIPEADRSYTPYLVIELAALLLLASLRAGRYGGLDFFLYSFRARRRRGAQKQGQRQRAAVTV
jgi:uncharacterized membrane protein YphA (DoxX/SURF4 family)